MPRFISTFSIHPENPRYFRYKENTFVILGSGERLGALVNHAFDYTLYLNELHDCGLHHTRLHICFREPVTGPDDNRSRSAAANPLAPSAEQVIMPYPRSGRGFASDGGTKWDLSRWNRDFFTRLRNVLKRAEERNIIVGLILFPNLGSRRHWSLHPFYGDNNCNGVGSGVHWNQFISKTDPSMFRHQQRLVEKVYTETREFPNLYYEICDRPFAAEKVTSEQVHLWQQDLIGAFQQLKRKYRTSHLVFAQGAYGCQPGQPWSSDPAAHAPYLKSTGVDAVTLTHDLRVNDSLYGGWHDHNREKIGARQLRSLGDAALLVLEKPLVICQDSAAVPLPDPEAWVVQRKRLWASLLSGLHYHQADRSFTFSDPGGRSGRKGFRKYAGICRDFIKGLDVAGFDFIHHQVTQTPPETTAFFIRAGYRDYFGYIVDRRETGEPGYGGTIEGRFVLSIGPGRYAITFYCPATGSALSKPHPLHGGIVNLKVPAFQHDLAFKITRA